MYRIYKINWRGYLEHQQTVKHFRWKDGKSPLKKFVVTEPYDEWRKRMTDLNRERIALNKQLPDETFDF